MVSVISSNDFEIPLIHPHSNNSKPIHLKGFPTFYSQSGQYLTPVNLWLNYLSNIKKDIDISSCVRAIKRYWNFLEKNHYEWNSFPTQNYLKPTYRFRNDDLLKSARNGEIAFSTASLYILHVIKFYEWAANEHFINFTEDNKPFNYQVVQIANTGMMNHNNPQFSVRSTDLRIRKPAKNEQQKLNPLSEYELSCFANCLMMVNEEFRIHQLLQIQSGLRIEEACTFPLSVIQRPDRLTLRYEVEIGPFNGVHTKYGKCRKIEVPNALMRRMYEYSISERRFLRIKKNLHPKDYLLINRFGLPFKSNNVQQHFRRLRMMLKQEHKINFIHKTHDLRATYGTYRLDSLLEYLPEGDALALVMSWMGHKDDKTTWKYLRYLRKEEANQSAILMLDQIMEEAMT